MEFDAHPDHRIEYTAKLEVARINRIPRFILMRGWGMGRGIHMDRARVRASMGEMINNEMDEADGFNGSLMNSFRASAIGWRIPYGPTMLGPFRSCM